jgi:hypothetical protein
MFAVLVYDVIHAHGCGSLWCITHAFEAILQLVNMMIVGRPTHLDSFLLRVSSLPSMVKKCLIAAQCFTNQN